VFARYLTDVRFERIAPADAAAQTIEEVDASVVVS
jgi:hypothetical protein